MARFYVPQAHIENGKVRVEGSEVRHIRKVLRLRAGDRITIFDGLGKEYEGSIIEMAPSSVVIHVEKAISPERESILDITLAQSLLKGEKMDYLVQKATELGIKEIAPFFSSRSVPLLDGSKRTERVHRWEKIAVEAAKQCGRGVVPRIRSLKHFSEVIESVSSDALRLLLWEKQGSLLKEVLKGAAGRKRIFFIVGPEGGLSQDEVHRAEAKGFTPIHLGGRILRAETASLCFLSILQYEWGDIG